MKKLLIIPITFLTAGSFFLSSYGNTSTDRFMKAPIQSNLSTSNKKANKESDEHKKKKKEEKNNKKNKRTSIFKPLRKFNEADTKAIYETQTALWL